MTPRIELVPNSRINRELWDASLNQCPNRLVYARSVYLDTLCPGWDALVAGYYEYLLPLPRKSKWGFRYIPDIPFLQQLGIFSPHPVTPEVVSAFIQKAGRHFSYGNIFLNYANPVQQLTTTSCNNYVLHLNKPYAEIAAGYNADLHYDLRQAAKYDLEYGHTATVQDAISAYRASYGERLAHITENDYRNFEQLCAVFAQNNGLVVRSVKYKGEMVAYAVLLLFEHRLYNLLSVNNAAGRKMNANHFLYNRLIEEFSGSNYIFDFEGSDIPGIAFFYRHFGAENIPYHRFHLNKLPWPLNRWKQ